MDANLSKQHTDTTAGSFRRWSRLRDQNATNRGLTASTINGCESSQHGFTWNGPMKTLSVTVYC